MGWRPKHLDKPLVAAVNSFNKMMPGHIHLNQPWDSSVEGSNSCYFVAFFKAQNPTV